MNRDPRGGTVKQWLKTRLEIFARGFVYFMYFLTGQYVCSKTSKWKSAFMTAYFVIVSGLICCLLNIIPFVITMVEWMDCEHMRYVYFNVCYSVVLHQKNQTDIPHIIMKSLDETVNESSIVANSLKIHQNELKMFTIYTKLVLLVTSLSSMTSYFFFFIALTKLYFLPHLKRANAKPIIVFVKFILRIFDFLCSGKSNSENDENVLPLHPFDDTTRIDVKNEDKSTSTWMESRQAFSYYLVLSINTVVNAAMLFAFFWGQYEYTDHLAPGNLEDFYNKSIITLHNEQQYGEAAAVSIYAYSLICTVFSCFIFSKVAYGIQNKYNSFNVYLAHVNIPDNDPALQEPDGLIYQYLSRDNKICMARGYDTIPKRDIKLYYLQERDKHFTKVAKKTIKVFEVWFFFHWILYIVSSFLSLSLFLETIVKYIQSSLPRESKDKEAGIDFQYVEMIFLGLFSASNCLFFLYPCIRAASVTDSRQQQIRRLNREYSNYAYITPKLKDRFANFLSSQNAGFDLHILCAKVPFGFSVAYISIFIALFSVLLKVATSI